MSFLLVVVLIAIIWFAYKHGISSLFPGVGSADSIQSRQVTGTVTGAHKHSETHVSGGGSGSGNGPISVSISSSSTVHQEFFVRDGDGVDNPIKIWGLDIPVADGQQVTICRSEIGERSRPAYLINHSARRGWPLYTDPSDVAIDLGVSPATPMVFIKGIAAGIAGAWLLSMLLPFGLVLAPLLGIAWIVVEFRNRKNVGRQLKARYLDEEKAALARPAASA
jgi:hypothetical protein